MAKLIKQSTANDPLFFFLTASSDHIAGLTGATATVTISKNGAAFAAPAGAVTEIANGWYQVAGNATDTNTLGDILLHATATSADPSDMVVAQVVAFDPRNANLGISNVSANVAQWNGTNVAAPATAGIPDVNTKNYNNVAAATDANNLPKVDVEDIAAVAVNTAVAQIGVNVVSVAAGATNIKKNIATNGFMFVMTDSTTHAPKTGVVVSATRSIDGAAFAATTNAPTEVGVGWYTINLSAADLNGNHIALRFTGTAADDTDVEIVTQP